MRATNFQSPFMERADEFRLLQDSLQLVMEGRGRFISVNAEAGAGKSRIVEELRRHCPSQVQFLCGRAFGATATTPFAVWVDALEIHLRSLHRRDLLHVLGHDRDLRRLFAVAAAQVGLEGAQAPPLDEIGTERVRLFSQVSAMIRRLSMRGPVVLALDNLQWADTSSVEMLHAVVRGIQDSPVLMLGLWRPEDAPQNGALQQCIASLEQQDLAQSMPLPPLSAQAIGAIVVRATGQAWPDDAVRQLQGVTQGNALFVWECVKHVMAREGGRPIQLDPADVLPNSIGLLIHERMRELPEDARRVLAVSSVVEADISYPLLRAVTAFSDERLLAALDKLTSLRFLDEVVSETDVAYEFHKPLVQASVYQGLGAARRRYLHQLVARELMRLRGSSATRIAAHLVAGSIPGESSQGEALPYLLEAARQAVGMFGNHEAVSLLTTARRIVAHLPKAAVSLFDLHLNLGESYKRLGRFKEAVTVWQEALPFGNDRERAALRRCVARALWQSGDELQAIEHLKAGTRDLGDAATSTEAGLLRQELALAMARQGDIASSLRELATVLEFADEDKQPELVARIYTVMCLALGYRGDALAAQNAGAKALALAEPLPYPGAAFLAHYTLAGLSRYEGDLAVFERHCQRCTEIASQMHAVALMSWPLSLRIERYSLLGRMDEAMAIGKEAVEIDKAIEQGTILPRSLAFLAVACRMAGRTDAARQYVCEAQALVASFSKSELRSVVAVGAAAAYIDFLDGRYGRALERVEQLLAHINRFEPLRFYALHPYMLPLAAEAAARMGTADKAREFLQTVGEMGRSGSIVAHALTAHVSGLLALHAGDARQAQTDLDRAISLLRQMNCRFDEARVRLDLAAAHEALASEDSARTELLAAGEAFADMGATRESAMVAQRLRKKGMRPTFETARPSLDQPISARETEVVALVAQGKSNKEIAAALFLSELTVETHMKNILRKLGLKSRAHVAAYACRADGPERRSATVIEHPAVRPPRRGAR